MGLVFLLVGVWLLVNLVRFRDRPGRVASQDEGSSRLEIGWTVAPAVLLAVIFVFTVVTMARADPAGRASGAEQEQPDIVVVGRQFFWEITYPSAGVTTANELHLPVGRRMRVRLEAADVIHSLWLPRLGGKVDLVPGQVNAMWLEADQPGIYLGQCAEFCGTSHAWMLLRAIAQPQAEYDAWLREQARPAATPDGGPAAEGARIFAQGTCSNCHAIGGTAARARVGPDLTHVATRGVLGSGVLDNTPEHMASWLRDPQAIKPGNHMPNLRLTDAEVSALTAYMETLR